MSVFEWVLVAIAVVCGMVLLDGLVAGYLERRRARRHEEQDGPDE